MGLQIRTKRDIRIVTGSIALLAVILSELAVAALYLLGGVDAFHFDNALLFAAIVPFLISVPITAYMTRQSLYLYLAQQQLQHLADTDPLTGLPNRRSFFRTAETLLASAARQGQPCTLLVIDADYFKNLNDSYGHAVGDRALVKIAEVLREKFRDNDLLCRVGGEEFAVMLTGIDAQTALPMAERVVNAVADSPLTEDKAIIEYSVSCGIADTSSSYVLPELFKNADDAMYQAKAQGRNRVARMRVAA